MRTSNPILSRRGFARDDRLPEPGIRQPQAADVGTHPQDGNPFDAHQNGSYPGDGDLLLLKDAPVEHTAMTLDDVLVRTAGTLGTVALAAGLS
ncbi:hypothetical protein [Kitasatospora sp. NPDC096204]|uniref:hypothetical protein n=1 Tax=Kitasatospora sp. NPDC096204 TaxID=3364094 RepID=UPI003810A3CC